MFYGSTLENMETPRIVIEYENENVCVLCQKHINKSSQLTPTEDEGVFELNICLMHPSCRKLHEKRKKLKRDLLDVEWLIFKKFMSE